MTAEVFNSLQNKVYRAFVPAAATSGPNSNSSAPSADPKRKSSPEIIPNTASDAASEDRQANYILLLGRVACEVNNASVTELAFQILSDYFTDKKLYPSVLPIAIQQLADQAKLNHKTTVAETFELLLNLYNPFDEKKKNMSTMVIIVFIPFLR